MQIFFYSDDVKNVSSFSLNNKPIWRHNVEGSLVPRAHVTFGQRQDKELWNNRSVQSPEVKSSTGKSVQR